MDNGLDFDRIKEMFSDATKEDVINSYASLRDDYEYMRENNLELKQKIECKEKEIFHIKRLNKQLLRERNLYRGANKIPVLFVRNNLNNKIHAVGSKKNDVLRITEDGQYIYFENEDLNVGTEFLQENNKNSQPYEFVNFDPVSKKIDDDDKCSTFAKVTIKEEE